MRIQPRGNTLVGLLIIIGIIWGISTLFAEDNSYDYDNSSSNYNSSYSGSTYNGYYDEDEYYDNYPVGFEGTETMEACNNDTGNCYDLDIDSDGENIERINFPNGGWRDVYSSDCEEGYCVVEDEDGTEWELQY